MSFVTLAEAKIHQRIDGNDEDSLLAIYLAAAERAAVTYLDRAVFVDQAALDAAKLAAPSALGAATAAYTAAMEAAQAITESVDREAAEATADNAYLHARVVYRQTMDGIVVTDTTKAAVLLMFGHFYTNREDIVTGVSVAALPNGASELLNFDRVY